MQVCRRDTARQQGDEGFDADAAIATGELAPMIDDLIDALGGEQVIGAPVALPVPVSVIVPVIVSDTVPVTLPVTATAAAAPLLRLAERPASSPGGDVPPWETATP